MSEPHSPALDVPRPGEDPDATVEDRFQALRPLAERLARKYEHAWGRPPGDLRTQALLGAWDAAQRWAPTRGVPLTAYACTRIAGAIHDEERRDGGTRARRRPVLVDGPDGPRRVYITSLDELRADIGPEHPAAEDHVRQLAVDEPGYDRVEDELWAAMILVRLPVEDAELLRRTAVDGETLADLGRTWRPGRPLTESRMCQLRARAAARAREVATA